MVVLLVGIISSVVLLNVDTGGAGRQLREESNRLAALLEQAADEAVMQNQEYGLRLTEDGYVFLCLDEAKQRWGDCTDSLFRARRLAEGLELRLLRESELKGLPAVAEESTRQDRDEAARLSPDLFLLSSGEASAARLELRVQEQPELHHEIRIDAVGRVTVIDENGKEQGHAG